MQLIGGHLCCLLLCLLGVTAEKTLRNYHPAHNNRKALLQEKTEPQELSDHDLIEEVLGGNVPSDEWEDSAHAAKKAHDVQLAKATAAVPVASPAVYESASPAAWQAASPAMAPATAPALPPVIAPMEPAASPAPAPAAAGPKIESLGDWVALLWQSIMDWLFPSPPAPKPPTADQVAKLDKATFAPASHEKPEEDSTFAPPGGEGGANKKKKRGHKGLDEAEQKASLMQNGKMGVAPAEKAVSKASWWWWAWPFAPTVGEAKKDKEGALEEGRVAALSGGTMIQTEDDDADDDDSA